MRTLTFKSDHESVLLTAVSWHPFRTCDIEFLATTIIFKEFAENINHLIVTCKAFDFSSLFIS